jgi:hypothetical protein
MQEFGHASLIGLAVWLAAVPALAAQENATLSRTVEFTAPAAADPFLKRADAEVRAILVSRGYIIAPVAPLRIELAWSRRPNDVALKSDGRDNGVQVAATPGRKRVDLCKDAIHRIVVARIETQTGAVTYRGSAELKRCGAPSDKDLKGMVRQSLAGLP